MFKAANQMYREDGVVFATLKIATVVTFSAVIGAIFAGVIIVALANIMGVL